MPVEVGTRLAGRYDLRSPLGEGGSALVFRAHDSLLDRDVAVKVMHSHVPDSDKQRFLREVRTLARLTHPGIVPVLDLGVDPGDGRPFFTMPLMTGGRLPCWGRWRTRPSRWRASSRRRGLPHGRCTLSTRAGSSTAT
ncbi:protein kinase [Deinococcus radiopugnans]|uniref:protein kinase domain-containing protein n=1 Tax=Deinococcus radiopugnans TaxID=57497 RepID=UPI00361EAABA